MLGIRIAMPCISTWLQRQTGYEDGANVRSCSTVRSLH